jgi:hypothetical protein
MDQFKKQNENGGTETPLAVTPVSTGQQPLKASVPVPVLPDSAQLAEARIKAQEQIKQIESKITAERSLWEQRMKEKNEQRISLKSQLEMIVRRGVQERDKKQSELALLKQQQEADLAEIERTLETEIKTWADKVSVKEKEAENIRHESMITETQKTVDHEQKLQALQRDLEQAQQKNKKLERQFLEEQTEWMDKIRTKDDEILQIMTQISLREAQSADDDQKSAAARKEREDSWQAQTRELEEKLANQHEEWSKQYAQKEAERISLKSALEERLAVAGEESEKKNADIQRSIARIEERSRVIEAAISEERAKWQEVLKGRDEELNKLRVALMLSESQEKAEREKRFAALKEQETIATRRIKDIASKIEEEKAQWMKNIATKDEELNVIKIQTTMKLKELHDCFERRKTEAEQEKVRLSAKLIDLNAQFAQEKAALNAALESKAAQVSTFQEECHAKQQALIQEEQQAVASLKTRKELLEKELTSLEQNIVQEKAKWSGIVWQKETELEAARKDSIARQNVLHNELDFLEVELKAGLEPLNRQIEVQEEQLWALRKRMEDEIAKKDSDRQLLADQFNAREEQYIRRIKTITDKYHDQEMNLAREIESLKNRINETQEAGRAKIEDLASGQTKLTQEIAALVEKKNAEKEELMRFYQNRKEELNTTIATKEAEQLAQKQQWETALSSKGTEVNEYEALTRQKLEHYQQQLTAKEKELSELSIDEDKDVMALKGMLAKARSDYAARIKTEQERNRQLEASLKETEIKRQNELDELKAALEQAIVPLEEQQHTLEAQLIKQSEEARAELAAREQRIQEYKNQQSAHEQKFQQDLVIAEQRLAEVKTEAHRILTHLTEDKAQTLTNFQKQLADIAATIAAKETLFSQREATHAQQCAVLEQTAETEKQRLKDEISRLKAEIKHQEKEFPQQIAVKVNEIAALEKQLGERAAFYAGQHEQAEQNFEKFQQRSQQRIEQANAELIAAKAGWQQEIAEAQKHLQAVLDEYAAKEAALQDELAHMNRQYSEEKSGFEKQKLLLEESLRDLEKRSRDDLNQKDKEILLLQRELAEKEKVWQANWHTKEEELAVERDIFVKQIATLESSLKQEEDLAQKRMKEKENEITFYKNQYTAKIQALTADINSKKQAWIDTNGTLSNQVTVLQQTFDETKKTSQEMRVVREKELSALKSNIEFWEIKTKNEEEKRLASWDDEKATLENQIKQLSQQLETSERKLSQKLDEKAQELAMLQAEHQALEDTSLKEWKLTEETYQRQQATMTAEIAALEQKIREGGAATERDCAAMDQAIEKLKLESTFKDTVKIADRNKLSRKWDKLKYTMEMQLKDLQEALEEERREWDTRISAKDEEIKTLGVRLTMRRDRREAEAHRRQEEAERIMGQLKTELETMESRYTKAVPEKQKEYEEKRSLLMSLQQEIKNKEALWQREVVAKDAAALEAYNELNESLVATEKELKKESERLTQLLALREKQIKGLTMQMSRTETMLVHEKEHTSAFIEALQQQALEFRASLRQLAGKKVDGDKKDTTEMFEKAMELYNANQFGEARDVLGTLITAHPTFAGAYQYCALCLYHLNDKVQAKTMAERALELDPRNEALQQWIESLNN